MHDPLFLQRTLSGQQFGGAAAKFGGTVSHSTQFGSSTSTPKYVGHCNFKQFIPDGWHTHKELHWSLYSSPILRLLPLYWQLSVAFFMGNIEWSIIFWPVNVIISSECCNLRYLKESLTCKYPPGSILWSFQLCWSLLSSARGRFSLSSSFVSNFNRIVVSLRYLADINFFLAFSSSFSGSFSSKVTSQKTVLQQGSFGSGTSTHLSFDLLFEGQLQWNKHVY